MGYISMRIFVKLSEISEFCVMNVGEVLGRFDDDVNVMQVSVVIIGINEELRAASARPSARRGSMS